MHIILIDANNIYRTFHGAMKDKGSEDSQERALSAMEATQVKIFNICRKIAGTHAVVCFDSEQPNWREEIYPEYKMDSKTGERRVKPESMISALSLCQENISNAGVGVIKRDGFEADDIIASIANSLKGRDNILVTIASNDKDFFQLYEKNIRGYQPFKETFIYESDVIDKYGFSGYSFLEVLTLSGDDADNIKGVKGVKEKTARKLLTEYGSIENIVLCSGLIKGQLGKNLEAVKDDIENVFKRIINLRDIQIELNVKLSNFRLPSKFKNPDI